MTLEDIISTILFLFSDIKVNNFLLWSDLYFTLFSPWCVCRPVGTIMTPNYISNSSSDVSLSCKCEGSGNQWQDCLRLQQMFTHNNCLREFVPWETGIVNSGHVEQMGKCGGQWRQNLMRLFNWILRNFSVTHSRVMIITWINQGYENCPPIIWDYSTYT